MDISHRTAHDLIQQLTSLRVSLAAYIMAMANENDNGTNNYSNTNNNTSMTPTTTKTTMANTNTWPFIMIENFEQQMELHLKQLDALSISISPYVSTTLRTEWEKFSIRHQENIGIEEKNITSSFNSNNGSSIIDDENNTIVDDNNDPIDVVVMRGDQNQTTNQTTSITNGTNGTNTTQFTNLTYIASGGIVPFIYRKYDNGTIYYDENDDNNDGYYPLWQSSPLSQFESDINYNLLDDESFSNAEQTLTNRRQSVVISPPSMLEGFFVKKFYDSQIATSTSGNVKFPCSTFHIPLYDGFDDASSEMVGILSTTFSWEVFYKNILDDTIESLIMYVEDSCGPTYKFFIDGPEIYFDGMGNHQDYSNQAPNVQVSSAALPFAFTHGCNVKIHLFPSEDMITSITESSNQTLIVPIVTVSIFLCTFGLFLLYDRLVKRSYKKSVKKVERSKSLVESMFPSNIRERVLDIDRDKTDKSTTLSRCGSISIAKPIADLHPNTTVLFADIANFTAWSSVREPAQVFTLLETLYTAFDKLAKRFQIFKVETIGT